MCAPCLFLPQCLSTRFCLLVSLDVMSTTMLPFFLGIGLPAFNGSHLKCV